MFRKKNNFYVTHYDFNNFIYTIICYTKINKSFELWIKEMVTGVNKIKTEQL